MKTDHHIPRPCCGNNESVRQVGGRRRIAAAARASHRDRDEAGRMRAEANPSAPPLPRPANTQPAPPPIPMKLPRKSGAQEGRGGTERGGEALEGTGRHWRVHQEGRDGQYEWKE
ncbi:hypothetical protein O3P69_001514 [Scylla paramamosain]|uniref:Uncharacterized protein n=1 Tax=Scylla paramamosain TaxID=85552 RepID=A0AAW0V2Y5_SCYPA